METRIHVKHKQLSESFLKNSYSLKITQFVPDELSSLLDVFSNHYRLELFCFHLFHIILI